MSEERKPVKVEFGQEEPIDNVLGQGKVGLGEQVGERAGIVKELFAFLWARKLWWMVPMMMVLLVFGILMLLASSSPAGAFIYTLF